MRIEAVHVRRFGGVSELRLGPLSPGMNIVIGPNESGKSTLTEFIRTTMFPSGPKGRYPEDNDGEGELLLIHDGMPLHLLRKGRKVKATSGAMPSDLLNGMDLRTYERVFAIDLEGLQGQSPLREDGIRSKLFAASAGLGSKALPDALGSIDKALGELMTANSRSKRIDQMLEWKREAGQRVRRLREQGGEYRGASLELERLKADLGAMQDRLEALRREGSWLETRMGARGLWMDLRAISFREDSLARARGFPYEGVRRMEMLLQEDLAIRSRIEELRERLASVGSGELSEDDLDLLQAERDILDLLEGKGMYRDTTALLPMMENDLVHAQKAIEDRLGSLGPGWDEERLASVDISMRAISDLRSFGERIRDHRERIREAEATLKELRTARPSGVVEEVDHGRVLELEAKERAIQRLRPLITRMEMLRMASDLRGPNVPWPLPLGISIALSAGAAIIGETVSALALVVIGGVSSFALMSSAKGGSAKREMTSLKERVDRVVNESRLPEMTDLASLDAEASRTAAELGGLRARRTLATGLGELMMSEEGRQRREGSVGSNLEELRASLAGLDQEWGQWSTERGFPEGMGPELALNAIGPIEGGREALAKRDGLISRIRIAKASISKVEGTLRIILEGMRRDLSERSTMGWLETLHDELERAKVRKAEHEALLVRREELTGDLRAEEAKWAEIRRDVGSLLEETGANDVEGFMALGAEGDELRTLASRKEDVMGTLGRMAGSEEGLKRLLEELAEGSREDDEGRVREIHEELEELNASRDILLQEAGELKGTIESLAKDADISAAIAEEGMVEDQLHTLIEEWATLAISRRLMDEARSTFERERQPEVIRTADRLMGSMTRGRYGLLHSPGEGLVLQEGATRKVEGQWSSGLGDQAFLALRLGMALGYSREMRPVPLILDDVLVRFDPERAAAAAAAISKVADEMQVILLTCRPEVLEAFEGSPFERIDLRA